jgi:hypothetical protein
VRRRCICSGASRRALERPSDAAEEAGHNLRRVAPIPDVDSSNVLDRKAALRQDWPGLATVLDDLAACPDLVTLLSH